MDAEERVRTYAESAVSQKADEIEISISTVTGTLAAGIQDCQESIAQTDEALSDSVGELSQRVSDQEDALLDYKHETSTYFRFNENGLNIGRQEDGDESPYSINLDNEQLTISRSFFYAEAHRLVMTASGGKLIVRQGGSTWTFDVPYDGKPAQLYRVRKSWSNVNSQIGAYSVLANAKEAADKAGSTYAVFDWNGKEVYRAVGVKVPYLVRVTKAMEIRKGPGTSYGKADSKCPVGLFTIVEVKGDWGRLKSGAGWIQLSKTEKM